MKSENNSFLFGMSCVLLFILILEAIPSWLIFLFSACVKLAEDFKGLFRLGVIVGYELAVIQGDKREHFVHLFFAIDGIHILSAYSIFLLVVAYDPDASRRD